MQNKVDKQYTRRTTNSFFAFFALVQSVARHSLALPVWLT